MADYILMIQLEVEEAHADEFNRLYDEDHMASLLAVDGVVSGRRYELERDGDNQLRYLSIYEVESPEVLESEAWQQAATTPGWMTVRHHITDRRRGVFRKM